MHSLLLMFFANWRSYPVLKQGLQQDSLWEFKPITLIEEIIIGGLMTSVLGGAVAYVYGKVG